MSDQRENIGNLLENLAFTLNLQPQDIINLVENATKLAWEKQYGEGYDLEVKLKNGELNIYRNLVVVDKVNDYKTEILGSNLGEVIKEKIDLNLNKVAISNILENLRKSAKELNKNNEYELYAEHVGKLFSCYVKKIDGREIILRVGNNEGVIPSYKSLSREKLSVGENIKCLLFEVKRTHGAQLFFERQSTNFIKALVAEEIPEIANGTIIIKNAVREAGHRSKLLVYSEDTSINPIGICIGANANRLNAITKELKGEKVDFILYKENLAQQIRSCFPKCHIHKIEIVPDSNFVEIVIDKENFGKVVGANGKNSTLTGHLIGKKIRALTVEESEAREEEKVKKIAEQIEGLPIEIGTMLLNKYSNLEKALEVEELQDEHRVAIEAYLNHKKNLARDKFQEMGGDLELFDLNQNMPSDFYFILLNNGIRTIDDLRRYNPKIISELTGLDESICVLLYSSL